MAEGIILKRRRPLLLNRFPNAAAAYSLRNLKATYVGDPVVRVRRSVDNAEAEFTATEVSDGTLATWVGADNDGFVTTWYDQSGNANDATQAAASSQPKIVSAGVLVTENGKAAIDFDGVGQTLTRPVPIDSISDCYASVVAYPRADQTRQYILKLSDFTSNRRFYILAKGFLIANEGLFNINANFNENNLYTLLSDNGDYSGFLNGQAVGYSGTHSATGIAQAMFIGSYNAAPGQFFDGLISEIIIYSFGQTLFRTQIESNINDYYGIY